MVGLLTTFVVISILPVQGGMVSEDSVSMLQSKGASEVATSTTRFVDDMEHGLSLLVKGHISAATAKSQIELFAKHTKAVFMSVSQRPEGMQQALLQRASHSSAVLSALTAFNVLPDEVKTTIQKAMISSGEIAYVWDRLHETHRRALLMQLESADATLVGKGGEKGGEKKMCHQVNGVAENSSFEHCDECPKDYCQDDNWPDLDCVTTGKQLCCVKYEGYKSDPECTKYDQVTTTTALTTVAPTTAESTSQVQCPQYPTSPGCWVFLPTSCPKQSDWRLANAATSWYRDTWNMMTYDTCADRVKGSESGYDVWCGVTDAVFHWVPASGSAPSASHDGDSRSVCSPVPAPPPTLEIQRVQCPQYPTNPGCWVFLPTSCPKQSDWRLANAATSWYRDTWNMMTYDACADRVKGSASSYDVWCGVTDAVFHWVPFSGSAPSASHDWDSRSICSE